MRKAHQAGFTLVEILIVVIILGILAAIVIPQFTEASSEARQSSLATNLQEVRGQIQLYKAQHGDVYPDATGLVAELTQYSNATGGTQATPDAAHTFGPYLQTIPTNPVSNLNTVRVVANGATAFAAPAADGGWYLNSVTGEFRADLMATHVDDAGTPLNQY
jgi:general secretion pathway protein G